MATAPEATLYFDGGSAPNPGRGGAGAHLVDASGADIWEGAFFVGEKVTNNHAEYVGLCRGLEAAAQLALSRVAVLGDSELVIKQMRGEYAVRSASLRPLFERARGLVRQIGRCTFSHIPRARNARADALAGRGRTMRDTENVDGPPRGAPVADRGASRDAPRSTAAHASPIDLTADEDVQMGAGQGAGRVPDASAFSPKQARSRKDRARVAEALPAEAQGDASRPLKRSRH